MRRYKDEMIRILETSLTTDGFDIMGAKSEFYVLIERIKREAYNSGVQDSFNEVVDSFNIDHAKRQVIQLLKEG